AGFRLAGEEPRAFENDVDAERLPRQLGRVALGEHLDAVAVDDECAVLDADRAAEPAVRGIVREQVRIDLRIAQVVECDELKVVLLTVFVMGAQDVAPDAAEAVDRYLEGHVRTLLTAFTTFSGVKPKCLKTSAAGADSPNVSMPTTAPSMPTYLRQKSVTPASTATRGIPRGRTESRYAASCRSNTLVEGIETTRTPTPSSPRIFCAASASGTSDPVAIRAARAHGV